MLAFAKFVCLPTLASVTVNAAETTRRGKGSDKISPSSDATDALSPVDSAVEDLTDSASELQYDTFLTGMEHDTARTKQRDGGINSPPDVTSAVADGASWGNVPAGVHVNSTRSLDHNIRQFLFKLSEGLGHDTRLGETIEAFTETHAWLKRQGRTTEKRKVRSVLEMLKEKNKFVESTHRWTKNQQATIENTVWRLMGVEDTPKEPLQTCAQLKPAECPPHVGKILYNLDKASTSLTDALNVLADAEGKLASTEILDITGDMQTKLTHLESDRYKSNPVHEYTPLTPLYAETIETRLKDRLDGRVDELLQMY